MRIAAIYLAVALPFVVVDLVWLKLVGERMYRPILGDILLPKPNPWPAALFYLIYPLGLVGFVVMPAFHDGNAARALVVGWLFGCITYATYDLTNQATLRNWSTLLTVADVLWGSALAAGCSFCGFLVAVGMATP
jgi:uncharacterized membrane protein